MSVITNPETGLVHVPSVLLTPRAFNDAHERAYRDIAPNPEGMTAIAEITGVSRMPDITIMRAYGRTPSTWDTIYKDADDDTRYIPAHELATGNPTAECYVTKAVIKNAEAAGKLILDLTVKDWDNLGSILAQAFEEAKGESTGLWSFRQVGNRVLNAFGATFGRAIMNESGMSPWQQRVAKAADVQPYIIRRGIDTTA